MNNVLKLLISLIGDNRTDIGSMFSGCLISQVAKQVGTLSGQYGPDISNVVPIFSR